MNWFNKIFSKKKPQRTETKDDSPSLSESLITKPSQPIKISNTPLPVETLRKFVPLRDLEVQYIDLLPYSVQTYAPGSTLFVYGQKVSEIYYLMAGTVVMQPESDNSYEIDADRLRANLPLNSSRICGATATAKEQVTLLVVDSELNKLWAGQSDDILNCVGMIDIKLPESLNGHRFFSNFIEAYYDNKLSLPSLPHVALSLKKAMEKEIGVNEVVDIIQIDPPIVSKLIQLANSPIYATVNPITNCHDAVTRLGLKTTRSLVMSLSLKQVFKCNDKKLVQGMQAVWKKSLYVSSLSFVLAAEVRGINPEDALLAGLITEIGTIPLLHFAEQYPDEYPSLPELEQAMTYLRGPVGSLVLHTLGFSSELAAIPHHAEDWFYDTGEQLDLLDIVILAKLHSYIGDKRAGSLPYINSIPAYSKLKNGELDPDFSLQALHKAKQRVAQAMQALA